MNEKTKETFAAPWTIEEEAPLAWYCVIDSKDSVVANDVRDQKTVNRLARLPELYEELKDAAQHLCWCCSIQSEEIDSPEIKQKVCKISGKFCRSARYWDLIKKVRDGE